MIDAIDLANDVLSQGLAAEVVERIQSGQWAVVSIACCRVLPAEMRRWCADMDVEDPIVIVLEPMTCR